MPRRRKCLTPRCRAVPPTDPHKAGWRAGLCRNCAKMAYKRAHTMRYAFSYHRASARRRGIVWALSFEEFSAFWMSHPEAWEAKRNRLLSSDTNKMRHNAADILEIDRKDANKGYEPGNIQLVTKRINVIRMWECRSKPPTFCVTSTRPGQEAEEEWDCPF